MAKLNSLLAIFLFSSFICYSQDEGLITKKSRLDKSAGVFISGGPSFTLGKNIGDYNTGINIEAGFLKRVNRVLSIGPSISYTEFKYDPKETGFNNVFIDGPYPDINDDEYYAGAVVFLEGGDISLTSLGFTAKLNFIPIKDNTVFSIYGFVRPTVSMVSRTKVTGSVDGYANYYDISNGDDWFYVTTYDYGPGNEFGLPASDKLESGTEVTGGIVLGPGVEIYPAKNVSFFLQASFGYTFPVTYVSTEAYSGLDLEDISEDYPMTKEGFPSVNIQMGISFNF